MVGINFIDLLVFFLNIFYNDDSQEHGKDLIVYFPIFAGKLKEMVNKSKFTK
jgi:hypothetical protein